MAESVILILKCALKAPKSDILKKISIQIRFCKLHVRTVATDHDWKLLRPLYFKAFGTTL